MSDPLELTWHNNDKLYIDPERFSQVRYDLERYNRQVVANDLMDDGYDYFTACKIVILGANMNDNERDPKAKMPRRKRRK